MTSQLLQGATRLGDWGVVRAHGVDAAPFLHNQLTNDIIGIDSGEARLAGYCSAKGRLLASLIVWRRGVDELLLACSADLLAPTLKRLSMFVLRAKCRLGDASADVALYGLAGDDARRWLGSAAPSGVWRRSDLERSQVIRLPDAAGMPRFVLAAPFDEPAPALPPLPSGAWDWLEVHSGVPRIVAATVERFVPQMVNFELVGGVNFQKGCYPGQEVVARSQYRGTLKRRAFLLRSDAPARPGQDIFSAADPDQPAGTVANAASLDGVGHAALAELKLATADTALRLGTPDGPPLHREALPYPLPGDAD